MTGTYRSLSRLLRMDRGEEICARGTNDLATSKFTTEDIPEADRIARWRDHDLSLGQIEPAQDHPFEAREISCTLPMLHLMSLTLSASRIVRTRVIEGNDEVALFVNRTGRAMISARGREAPLAPGDGVLISCNDAMVYDRLSHGELLSIRVPRSVLSPVVVGIDGSKAAVRAALWAIDEAVDAIHRRYGNSALTRAVLVGQVVHTRRGAQEPPLQQGIKAQRGIEF